MASYFPPKYAVAYIIYIGLESVATAGTFQSSPTLASGDFKVSIDGGALANLATLPTVTPAAGKMVKVSLSSGEMTGDNITVVCSDAAGSEWKDLIINLQTAARQIDDLATPTNITAGTITTATNVTTVNGLASGVITATSIAANAITAAKVATDAIGAAQLATDAVTEIQSGLATAAALAVVAGYIDTEVATLVTNVAAILQQTGTDGVALSTAVKQAIADAILKRGVSHVDGSAEAGSLYELIEAAFESAISGSAWTIYQSDHSTVFSNRTVTTDADALPIVGVT